VTEPDAARTTPDMDDAASRADAPEGRMAAFPLRFVPHEVNGETQPEGESS
jgi:hypothetical protein